jgi:hypothetical protein
MWEIVHAAVSRRPLNPPDTIVAHTEGYTYVPKVEDCPSFKDHFLSRAKPSRFAISVSRYKSIAELMCQLNFSIYQSGSVLIVPIQTVHYSP